MRVNNPVWIDLCRLRPRAHALANGQGLQLCQDLAHQCSDLRLSNPRASVASLRCARDCHPTCCAASDGCSRLHSLGPSHADIRGKGPLNLVVGTRPVGRRAAGTLALAGDVEVPSPRGGIGESLETVRTTFARRGGMNHPCTRPPARCRSPRAQAPQVRPVEHCLRKSGRTRLRPINVQQARYQYGARPRIDAGQRRVRCLTRSET